MLLIIIVYLYNVLELESNFKQGSCSAYEEPRKKNTLQKCLTTYEATDLKKKEKKKHHLKNSFDLTDFPLIFGEFNFRFLYPLFLLMPDQSFTDA